MIPFDNIHSSPVTAFNKIESSPVINSDCFIHQLACIIGKVNICRNVFVAPFAVIRGDEGSPIYIGENTNIQDGVVIHGLINTPENLVKVGDKDYSVYLEGDVSLAHQSQVHGPAYIGKNVFIGMQSLIFRARIGENVVIEPGAKVIGVDIPANVYIPAGMIIDKQELIINLTYINEEYSYKGFNKKVVSVNTELAQAYQKLNFQEYVS